MFKKEITVGADVKNLEAVTAFVDECLEQFDCPLRAQMQLDVAVDGIKAGELSFEWTATGWGTFDPDNFAELSVQLSAGTHTIEIIRPVSGGNSAELDAMTLMADTRGN